MSKLEEDVRNILDGKLTQHDAAVEVIDSLQALLKKREATVKELSKEVHDLETRVAELEKLSLPPAILYEEEDDE